MNSHRILWIALPTALFVWGTAAHLDAPLTYWDSALLQWAGAAADTPAPAGTSPLFLMGLRLLASLGLDSPFLLRWIQALGAILSAFAAALLAKRLDDNPNASVFAFAMYLSSAAVIQGTQSVDMADASFYPAAVALYLAVYTETAAAPRSRLARLGMTAALAFLCKTTSTLGLLLFPAASLLRDPAEWRNRARESAATVIGFVAGGVVWWLPLRWETFGVWGEVAVNAMQVRNTAALALHSALIIAWFGPFFLALAAIGSRQSKVRAGLAGGTVLYALGYLLIVGTNHGFPRYHLAILPILCAWAAIGLSRTTLARRLAAGVAFMVLLFVLLVGDPVYSLNVGMRLALLDGNLAGYTTRLIAGGSAFLLLVFAVARLLKFSASQTLAAATLAYAFSLAVVQNRAEHVTAYSYGEEGRQEVIDEITRSAPPGANVLAPPNLIYELRARGFNPSVLAHWPTRDSVLTFIRISKPAAIVLDVTGNTTWQIQWLLREPPPEIASCRDRYRQIGTHWLCLT